MGDVIVVTSGKGGAGKTTTTANLGVGLAKLNKKVCVIDMDLGLRNLDVVIGLENQVVYNLVDVIEGRCDVKKALIEDKRFSGLYFLSSAQTVDKTFVSPEQVVSLVESIKEDFDFILLDCPAGIEQGFKNAIAPADTAVVVTTPINSAIRDADRIRSLLERSGIRRQYLIVNRMRADLVNRGHMMSVNDILDVLPIDLIGVVPEDENIIISTNKGLPLVGDSSDAGKAYMNICKRLSGVEVPMLNIQNKNGIFSKLFKK